MPLTSDQVWPVPSASVAFASYEYRMSSVAVVGAVLSMTGASLTPPIVTVVVWIAQRLGDPRSQTRIDTTQDGGGVGDAGVKVKTPVPATIDPPQVCKPSSVQLWPTPSGSTIDAS